MGGWGVGGGWGSVSRNGSAVDCSIVVVASPWLVSAVAGGLTGLFGCLGSGRGWVEGDDLDGDDWLLLAEW